MLLDHAALAAPSPLPPPLLPHSCSRPPVLAASLSRSPRSALRYHTRSPLLVAHCFADTPSSCPSAPSPLRPRCSPHWLSPRLLPAPASAASAPRTAGMTLHQHWSASSRFDSHVQFSCSLRFCPSLLCGCALPLFGCEPRCPRCLICRCFCSSCRIHNNHP